MSPLSYGATTSSMLSEGAMSAGGGMTRGVGVARMGAMAGSAIWIIIAAAIAIIGALVLYFTFLSKKNDGRFKGFWGWTYDFLNFKKLTIEAILKITYLMLTIFITLGSFVIIPSSPLGFLAAIILGNLVLRIIYEFSLVILIICRNTTEINTKLNKKD